MCIYLNRAAEDAKIKQQLHRGIRLDPRQAVNSLIRLQSSRCIRLHSIHINNLPIRTTIHVPKTSFTITCHVLGSRPSEAYYQRQSPITIREEPNTTIHETKMVAGSLCIQIDKSGDKPDDGEENVEVG